MKKVAVIGVISAATAATCLAIGGTAQAATVVIEAQDNKFAPIEATAAVGDTVVFKNTGKSVHNAKSKDGAIGIDLIDAGGQESVVLKKAGIIEFICTFHEAAGMKGKLTLAAASGPAPGGVAPPAPTLSPDEKESDVNSATSKKKAAAKDTEPVAEAPPSQKYFPTIALAMLALLGGLIALSYRRNMAPPAGAAPGPAKASEPQETPSAAE